MWWMAIPAVMQAGAAVAASPDTPGAAGMGGDMFSGGFMDGSGWTVATSGSTARAESQRISGEPASGIGGQLAAASFQPAQLGGEVAQYLPWIMAGLVLIVFAKRRGK